jgi:raffinose/stachyose/melibiose transport system permease protein
MKAKKNFFNIIKNLIVCIMSFIMLVPLYLMVTNSLKTKTQAASMGIELPQGLHLHFENYISVIQQGKLLTSFLNSMGYSCGAILISIILSSMAAFVLARYRSKFNNFIYFFIVLGLALPASYITLMQLMKFTHLLNTFMGVILNYVAMEVPVSIFILYAFIGSIPKEMDEAAVIDGCGPLRMFYSIIIPLMKPGLVTVVILTFMDTWNQFVYPLYLLNDSSKWPMTLSVYNFFGQFSFTQQWNLVSADVVLTSLPVLILYLAGQKYIISGMTVGAVKG